MNIFVALKQVAEASINPFDEIALEAALRFRESPASLAGQRGCDSASHIITVVSVGPMDWENSLRTALAMGADQAIRIEAPIDLEPLLVAKCLASLATREGVDLILTGRQSVDGDHNQTGQMTAALLGWGQATCAVDIQFFLEVSRHETNGKHETSGSGHKGEAIVLREVDNGRERWAVPLPAVITVDLRLNAIHETGGPRYASLPNIMRARRKPLRQISPVTLGVSLVPKLHCLAYQQPAMRPPGKRLQTVDELVWELQTAGLI